ncbi:MAG TPA: hypothetical protein VMT16_00220, partial [Thermoanaerobaculia bacterium]|nr:hypothetical protein [Thermoanaerobaculia bacterium]
IRLRELPGQRVALSARVSSPRGTFGPFRLEYRVARRFAGSLRVSGDAFAAGLLLPAMALGEDLRIEGPVSPSLVRQLAAAAELLAGWGSLSPHLRLRQVAVRAELEESAAAGGTGLFFTGGVDSFYSAHALGSQVDRLVFVHGFDISLANRPLRREVSRRLGEAAAEMGLELVEVATNYRRLSDPIVGWVMSHGGALAAVGHALAGGCSRFLLSSSDAYVTRVVYGTHPDLDPRWSSDSVAFASVGSDLKRKEKLAALCGNGVARRHLWVCWENRRNLYNCCRCGKCLRTMLQLEALGARRDFPTFPDPPPVALVERMREPAHRLFIWRDLAEDLGRHPGNEPLTRSIAGMIARSEQAARSGRARGRRMPYRELAQLFRGRWATPLRRIAWTSLRVVGTARRTLGAALHAVRGPWTPGPPVRSRAPRQS